MLKRPALAMTGPLRGSLSGRFLLAETAGSLGDLGTFIPIAVGMVQIVGLDAASVLVFAGLMNLVTGLVFRIPIAVQPMKAIAALAIVGAMGPAEVCVAGMTVGLAVLVLAGTGLIDRMSRFVPTVVVRGLQATVAFHLFLAAGRFALWVNGKTVLRSLWGVDGLLVVAGALLAVVLFRRRLTWVTLGLVAAGFVAAGIGGRLFTEPVVVTLWRPTWILSNLSSLRGVWLGGLPQLPLTLLNSVLAIAVLATQLFPERQHRTTPAKIAVSVGLMNLVSCPFGGMPLCHGSGGLAGQYRFGARSGVSMVILGTAKLLVGLFMGTMALAWLHAFPSSILTVFLIGHELQIPSKSLDMIIEGWVGSSRGHNRITWFHKHSHKVAEQTINALSDHHVADSHLRIKLVTLHSHPQRVGPDYRFIADLIFDVCT